MPRRAPRPCRHPGCAGLTTAKRPYCPTHLPQYERARIQAINRKKRREVNRRHDAKRPCAAKRGYGRNWRLHREMFLHRHPLCEWPEGCREFATEVDHKVSLAKGGTHEDDNLQALCKSHHSMKTAREDRKHKTWVDEMGRKHKA